MHFHANATDDIQEMQMVDQPPVQNIVFSKLINILEYHESLCKNWRVSWTRRNGTTYLRCLNLTTFEIAQLTSPAPDISIIFQQNPATAQVVYRTAHSIHSLLLARDRWPAKVSESFFLMFWSPTMFTRIWRFQYLIPVNNRNVVLSFTIPLDLRLFSATCLPSNPIYISFKQT